MTVFGPYENERDTHGEPMPQAVRNLHRAGPVRSGDPDRLVRDTVLSHLITACENAGVQIGARDRQSLQTR